MFGRTKDQTNAIKLGQRVRDKVTGFSGVAVGTAQHITGCDTVGVNPGIDKDGKLGDTQWFDWTRLEVIDARSVMDPAEIPGPARGGPQEHPKVY